MSEFAIYVEDRLKHAGFSHAQFAAGVGISPQYLSDMKRGARPVTDDVIEGMHDALGCERDEAYWIAGRVPPDVEALLLEGGPQVWEKLRSWYGLAGGEERVDE